MDDLRQVTAVVPVRCRTPDRLNGALVGLHYLHTHWPEVRVVVVEYDDHPRIAPFVTDVDYLFYRADGPWNASAARNIGLRAARTDWVLVVDADTFAADPQVLPAALAHGKPLVRLYRTKIEVDGSFYQLTRGVDQIDKLAHTYGTFRCQGTCGLLLLRRSIFDYAGYYDEEFTGWGCEESEFTRRVERLTGTRLVYCDTPAYHVAHEVAGTTDRQRRLMPAHALALDAYLAKLSDSELRARHQLKDFGNVSKIF